MKNRLIVTLLFLLPLFIKAQTSANTTSFVTAHLIKGLSITKVNENGLNFGEIIISGSGQNKFILNKDGQEYRITGHPGRIITLSYDQSVPVSNTEGTLTFQSNTADYTASENYEDPFPIESNGTATLKNIGSNGIGLLNIWLGGNIEIPANQSPGEYLGQFSITVSY
jgi:hypothetical protein